MARRRVGRAPPFLPDDFCIFDECLGNLCEERYCVDTPDEVDYCLLGLGILEML